MNTYVDAFITYVLVRKHYWYNDTRMTSLPDLWRRMFLVSSRKWLYQYYLNYSHV